LETPNNGHRCRNVSVQYEHFMAAYEKTKTMLTLSQDRQMNDISLNYNCESSKTFQM